MYRGEFEQAFQSFSGLLDQQLAGQQRAITRRLAIAPWVLTLPILLGVGLLLRSRRSLALGFVHPMQTIIAGTQAMHGGNLEQTLPEDGVAEVREIARGINRMAAELVRSRHALLDQERQAALGALVPVVAHNIRNPLAAIRANAQLLDGSDSVAEVHEIRAAIIETVDRLGRWVTALVSYLHPLHPRRQPVRAVELIEAGLYLLAPRLDAQGVRCVREPWDDHALINADRDLLEQALYGLLNNAVEASSSGGTLTVSVIGSGDEVRLMVCDEGGGIPFMPEPSELAPGPSTKRFGTGLGIPIAFKICSTHGFRLDFVVHEGRGTDAIISAARHALQ